jgi:saccharopine dehydrogenase (NAD+, L-lysine-forming)
MSNPRRILYIRSETIKNEHRTPIVPKDIPLLLSYGYTVYIESAHNRIYNDSEYSYNGAIVTEKKWWDSLFQNAYILGLKEVADIDKLDSHTHVYFSHSYKGQTHAKELLETFAKNQGTLYDLEYFLDDGNNRVVSFGFYAGVAGCYLGLLQYLHKSTSRKNIPSLQIETFQRDTINAIFEKKRSPLASLRIAIVGGGGNCGKGVISILQTLGAHYDVFGKTSDKSTLHTYDIVFNCIKLDPGSNEVWFSNTTEFRTPLLIVDISCDPSQSNNPISIYKEETTWENPVLSYNEFVDIIAISNLPSLLPKESSDYFSSHCVELFADTGSATWEKNKSIYLKHIEPFI